jgi:ABC-type amino acid transport substrate-binding protein
MVFVPFAAWFSGQELNIGDQFVFLGSVVMSSFVAPIAGIPFLLDILKLPNDVFQLFIISTAFTDRVRVVLGAMHLFTLSIIAIAYAKGIVKISFPKILRAIGLTVLLSVVVLLPIKWLIGDSFQESFDKYETFVKMDLKVKRVKEVTGDTSTYVAKSMQTLRGKGKIRVGYMSAALPYVFKNDAGQLVGYDVELMHIFASEIGIDIQWVEIPRNEIVRAINGGKVDVFLSGVPVLADVMDRVEYGTPYSEINLALLVKDHDRDLFKSKEKILANPEAVFATNQSEYLRRRVKEEIPNINFITISSPRNFLLGKTKADALFFSAEAGSAWTLVYPAFSVVRPDGLDIKLPVSMMLAKNNLELRRYMDNWIELKKFDGTIERLYQSWILGEASKSEEKPWSVLRDILHWVD